MDTANSPVSCPVCTLYLREGVSLQNHLNTHPKDQVIEALVKCCNTGKGRSALENALQQLSNDHSGHSLVESGPSNSSSQQYPSCGSHFTAAVTYQQFMSSNASVGGAVLPQCFSVPAIVTGPTGDGNQTTLMPLLYNPYIIQQQQQQLQFYNSFRTVPPQPLARQILSPSSTLFPISQQFNINTPIIQNSVPVSSTSSLQTPQNVQVGSSVLVPSTSNGPHTATGSVETENSSDIQSQSQSKINELPSRNSPQKSVPVQCDDMQEASPASPSTVQDIEDDNDDDIEGALIPSFEINLQTGTVVVHSGNKSRSNSISESEKSLCGTSQDKGDDEHSNDADGPDDHVQKCKSVSPSLRVRGDLNVSSCEYDIDKDDDEDDDYVMAVEVHNDPDSDYDDPPNVPAILTKNEELGNLSEIMKSSLADLQEDNCEYITSDYMVEDVKKEKGCEPQPSQSRKKDSAAELNEPGQFNLVDIDGLQIIVPSHFLGNGEVNRKLLSSQIACSDASKSSVSNDTLPGDVSEASAPPVSSQDIKSDEVMLPKGELSGQDSLGENDANSWFQEKDEVSTSYDLLARESWAVSDGSDDDNDAGIMAGSTKERRPVLEPPLQLIPKKKEKLKCVYKCWYCPETFTCPKERRVHQSERHTKKISTNKPAILAKKVRTNLEDSWNSSASQGETVKREIQDDIEVPVKPCEALAIKPDVSDEVAEPKNVGANEDSSKLSIDIEEIKLSDEQPKEDSSFKCICTRCDGEFSSVKSLQRHIRTVHRRNHFTCRTCDEEFPSEATYLLHLKIHPLECTRCGKYFYRHQNLNLHIKRHLGIKPFKCSVCDKGFVTKQKLAEHTNTHTGNAPIKCNLCSETFRRYSNLIQHKNRHHYKVKKKVKDFICHCGEIFHSKKKLEWHKEIHDEKPKTCNYCSERFVHASSLTRHVRKAHDQRYFPNRGREGENVECPVCACVFLKSSLPVHMRVHSGERPFNCHICGKNFSTKWNLQLHRWTHASRSMKPFKCSLCKSAFYRHSEYTSHMHSHRNIRPYTCNYCGSQFIRKYNCLRHAKEHESEKPFSCNICQKTFHRSYYLKEHMRIHSGLRPFTCHICGKASTTKSNHNKHVKIHHAREAVNTEG